MLRNSDATYAQTWGFQSDTNKDLVITGSSGAGGFKFVPGSRGSTFTGDVTSTGVIKSNSAEATFKLTSTHSRETVLNQGGGNFHIQPDHGSGVGISYGNTTHPGLSLIHI